MTKAYFPTKAYGDLVLPCGTYDTVQVDSRKQEADMSSVFWYFIRIRSFPRFSFLLVILTRYVIIKPKIRYLKAYALAVLQAITIAFTSFVMRNRMICLEYRRTVS
mgnify:CR=1 FL=1